ncbi:Acetyltransferase [Streptococcus oralis]|nr:Acetyltransferase [Streptococcus oralis]
MEIRLAFPNEVDAIMQVMEDAKKCLAKSGSDQWQNGYPNADIIIDDIISGQAYVALEEGELLAYAAVTKSPDEAYEAIYEGSWQGGRIRISGLSPYRCGSRCPRTRCCSDFPRRLD